MTGRRVWVSPTGQVRLYPPTDKSLYWRVRYQDAFGRNRTTHVGRDQQKAFARAIDLQRRLSAGSGAARRGTHMIHLFEAFADPVRDKRRPGSKKGKKEWSPGYADIVKRTLDKRVQASLGRLPLAAVTPRDVAATLSECQSESHALRLRNILRAVVNFGVRAEFLRQDQALLWNAPLPTFEDAPIRLRSSDPQEGESDDFITPEEIPSDDQVRELSRAQVGYLHWEPMVHVLAYCGLRVHECIALSAPAVRVEKSGRVELLVRRQLVELAGGGTTLTLPKNGRARTVPVPETTPTGFPLAAWLRARATEATTEAQTGLNVDALLFPSPRKMTHWRLRNLRRRLFDPAAEQAGWPSKRSMRWVTYSKNGKAYRRRSQVRMWLLPLHSLRHRFATTALEDWSWSGTELCTIGGWSTPDFVYRTYIGTSKAAVESAASKQVQAGPPATWHWPQPPVPKESEH